MDARREQIRGLLTAARARIDPCEVGIRRAGRLRSPGLRREDVAVLAGVSVKWYTWLEQGREVNFSTDVVSRVASVLKLSSAEQSYLAALTRRPSGVPREYAVRLTDTLWRTIRYMPVPAMVMTRRWDILAWNGLMTRVFRDYGAFPDADRNLLRIILTDKRYQSDWKAFEELARKLLREFRIDFGQFAGDPDFEALVVELKASVPDFETLWQRVEVCDSSRGVSLIDHSEFGNLAFDRITYVPEGNRYQRVMMFTPQDAVTARVVDSIRPFAPEAVEPDFRTVLKVAEANVLRHTNSH